MKTIQENNKLIAEFMEWEVIENQRDLFVDCNPNNEYAPLQLLNEVVNDWNWLMEVVDKIESLDYWLNRIDGDVWVQDNEGNVIINNTNHQGGKEAVYNACLEFIKWYNQQK